MSDAAMQFSSEATQQAVLVVGELNDERRELLKQKMEIMSSFDGGRPCLSIRIEVDAGLRVQSYRHGHSYTSSFAEYLQAFSRMLATNVVVSKVFSSDPCANIKSAFLLVFPNASYEVLGSETDDPEWRCLSEIPIEELDGSGLVLDDLKLAGVHTFADLARKSRSDLEVIFKAGLKDKVNVVVEAFSARGLSLRADD